MKKTLVTPAVTLKLVTGEGAIVSPGARTVADAVDHAALVTSTELIAFTLKLYELPLTTGMFFKNASDV